MGNSKYTIGFFYYNFYPVVGGASVHGYNLAKELVRLGHRVIKINGAPDPYTEKRAGFFGFLYTLLVSDIVYVRVDYFLYPRNFIPVIAGLLGKPVITELNSPSDELKLFGYGERVRRRREKIVKFILGFADVLITVSDVLKRYAGQVFGHPNISVINNGGEYFNLDDESASDPIRQEMELLNSRYDRMLVWAGSPNKMQELNLLNNLAGSLDGKFALIILSKKTVDMDPEIRDKENIFVKTGLDRKDVTHIIRHSDAGLALYENYEWCEWGFYNSSLKLYEYLCNGLPVITNKTELTDAHEQVYLLTDPENINTVLEDLPEQIEINDARTWKQVARETEERIVKVLTHD